MSWRWRTNKSTSEISKEKLGYEINQDEIRFIVYMTYEQVNGAKLNPKKLRWDEIIIFDKYFKKWWITLEEDKFFCTKEFWLIIQEIIYHSYVNWKNEIDNKVD